MEIYKLTFNGGLYEDKWEHSIIFSSFENAKKALYEQFFKRVDYDYGGEAQWSIKAGFIDHDDWHTLVKGYIKESLGITTLYTEDETPIMKAKFDYVLEYDYDGEICDKRDTVELVMINEITLSE